MYINTDFDFSAYYKKKFLELSICFSFEKFYILNIFKYINFIYI